MTIFDLFRPLTLGLAALVLVRCELPACAHEAHQAVTYEVTAAWKEPPRGPYLRLRITDDAGDLIAARFSLTVNGVSNVPQHVGSHGLRFVSVHKGKQNTIVATYARGTGDVTIPLPDGAVGTVTVAKGFEYRTATESFRVDGNATLCTVRMHRWINLTDDGWRAADEHLHYERVDPSRDKDWLTMVDADGLSHAHFLVLKGGNVPGVWAQQYAYGAAGEAQLGDRFIRSGEEYRDSSQGHINLLGISKVIEPISTGGIGGSAAFNYPPLLDVLRQTRKAGGLGGPAHGGALAKSSTALLDTVLGGVGFFEIANSHLYKTDVWYLLLNCGYILPPVAGTDLPNFGYRDSWQPLFGEVRTYVRVGNQRGFDAWAAALERGEVFITSGPLIRFTVNGKPSGSIIRLPAEGGEVSVVAELSSPRQLESLEVVSMGKPISVQHQQSNANGITTYSVRQKLLITESCWMAARGTGGPKKAIEAGLGISQSEIAHTGVVQILVGNNPIHSSPDVDQLRARLVEQQDYYRTKGRYEKSADRQHVMQLFEKAIEELDR